MTQQENRQQEHTFIVGPWVFNPHLKELTTEGGAPIKLEDKIAHVLEVLCRHDGAVVSKEELISVVWDGREVSEQTIPVAISKLRKTLGDSSADPKMLQTVPRKGYRLMVPPTEAAMEEALEETTTISGLTRFALAVSLLAIILVGWSLLRDDSPTVTSPVDASKPGIVLTLKDVRAPSEEKDDLQSAVALSELASYYLSHVPDVLLIRHWWNLDAEDPTGGIFTRYGEATPVYTLTGTLIDEGERTLVTLQLSDPKTDEVLWTGLHDVSAGSRGYFATLNQMLSQLGTGTAGRMPEPLASPVFEDQRFWSSLYLAHLSTENTARSADKGLQLLAMEQPEDPLVLSARHALAARWGLRPAGAIVLEDAGVGYLGLVDRAVVALYARKDAAAAEALLKEALEDAPGDHYAQSLMAEAKLARGDVEGAIAAYRKAVRLAPFATAYSQRLVVLEGASETAPKVDR